MEFSAAEYRRDWARRRQFVVPDVVWYPHSAQPLPVSGIDGLIVGDFYLG